MILVGIAALAGGLLLALSFMVGDNGTLNDANNRGQSGEAHNPTGTAKRQQSETAVALSLSADNVFDVRRPACCNPIRAFVDDGPRTGY